MLLLLYISGMVEMHRLVLNEKNPAVKRMQKIVDKIVQEETSQDSDEVEEAVETEVMSFFDKFYTEAIKPIAVDIDGLNGGMDTKIQYASVNSASAILVTILEYIFLFLSGMVS